MTFIQTCKLYLKATNLRTVAEKKDLCCKSASYFLIIFNFGFAEVETFENDISVLLLGSQHKFDNLPRQ